MEVNEYQIGGDHYRSEYQHWDWVIRTNQPYVLGCATKYISRWRKKNGIQDLRKSLHYLNKAIEYNIEFPKHNSNDTVRFCDQLHDEDAQTLLYIAHNNFESAIKCVEELITEIECGPSSNYVDPDNNYIKG